MTVVVGLLELHAELAEEYRARNLSERTIEWYGVALQSFSSWARAEGVSPTLDALTLAQARAYIVALRRRGLSDHSINCYVRALRGFASWMRYRGILSEHRLETLIPPRTTRYVAPVLSDEEIWRVLDAAISPRDRAMVCLFLDTGARAAEVTQLRLADLELDVRRIHVMGKGRKERWLPLGQSTAAAIRAYVSVRRATSCKYVFVTAGARPGRAMGKVALADLFGRLRRRSGVLRLHPHLLRHTFACRWLVDHNDPLALQQLLGHESLAMTLYYTRSVQQLRVLRQAAQGSSVLDGLGV